MLESGWALLGYYVARHLGPQAKLWWELKFNTALWEQAHASLSEWWRDLDSQSSFPKEFGSLITEISQELPPPTVWQAETEGQRWELIWVGPEGEVTVRFHRNRTIRLFDAGSPSVVETPERVIAAVRAIMRS